LYFLANAGIAFALPEKNVRKRNDKTTKKMVPINIRLIFTPFPGIMMKMTPDQKTRCNNHLGNNGLISSFMPLKSKDAILSVNETIPTLNYGIDSD